MMRRNVLTPLVNALNTLPDASLDVTVAMHDPRWQEQLPGAVSTVETIVRHALAAQPHRWRQEGDSRPVEVACILTNDREIHELNLRFRGKDAATNVLSFVADPTGPQEAGFPRVLGDIIVSLDTLEREAKAQGKVLRNHVCHMIVHGALHLLGYDHVHEDDAIAMESREIDLLASLGISNPYAELPYTSGEAHGG